MSTHKKNRAYQESVHNNLARGLLNGADGVWNVPTDQAAQEEGRLNAALATAHKERNKHAGHVTWHRSR